MSCPLYVDCDKNLTWEQLFRLLAGVSSTGCASIRVLKNGGEPPEPLLPLQLEFDDLANTPVVDPSDVAQWNTFFNLPANGTPFTAVDFGGTIVNLYGGGGITVSDTLFSTNTHLLSIDDQAMCIVAIGFSCFDNCTQLTSVTLNRCVSVGGAAFALTPVVMFRADICQSIGDLSFLECSNLSSLIIPAIVSIGQQAFNGCVQIPSFSSDTLVDVAGGAFNGCSVLTAFIATVCTSIGDACMQRCVSLMRIEIPSCINLGSDAGLNNVWRSIGGNVIDLTVPAALMTNNAGSPDEDIIDLDFNNTVTITQV